MHAAYAVNATSESTSKKTLGKQYRQLYVTDASAQGRLDGVDPARGARAWFALPHT